MKELNFDKCMRCGVWIHDKKLHRKFCSLRIVDFCVSIIRLIYERRLKK